MSVRPITDTLRLLQGGTFLDTASDKLAEVVRRVDETGKAGTLTIKLSVTKSGGALAVLADVTNKAPEPKPDADLFWPTVEGNLSTENPNQRRLDLRPVAEPQREVRQVVDRETGEIRSA